VVPHVDHCHALIVVGRLISSVPVVVVCDMV
jgi:hypothetical protein